MLTPNYINNEIPRRLVELMGDIETDMLKRVAHYVGKYRRVTGSAEFLALKQTQYNLLYDDLLDIVSSYSGMTEVEVARIFSQSAVKSIDYDSRLAANAGHAITTVTGATTASAAAMQQTLDAAIQRALSVQNLTNTKCLQSALDAFTRASDRAFLSVATGAQTFDSAYRQAVDEIIDNGISVVEYDRGGRVMRYSVEAATRRNLITSVNQTIGKIQEQNCALLGCNLVQTTSHAGARPSHAEWQGGIYWINEPVKGYDSLVDACGYGEADGLKGINCYHDFFPYFEGMPRAFDSDPSRKLGIDNDKLYALNQKQRYLERQIRAAKKGQEVYQAAGMTAEAKRAGQVVREKQAQMRDFLDQNPLLRRDYTRERIG